VRTFDAYDADPATRHLRKAVAARSRPSHLQVTAMLLGRRCGTTMAFEFERSYAERTWPEEWQQEERCGEQSGEIP